MNTHPNLKLELDAWEKGQLICGIDEVGRGSFAGPLVIGAVILKKITSPTIIKKLISLGINDSKLLSPLMRKKIYTLSQEYIEYSLTEFISVEEINEIGIGNANKLGFKNVSLKALRYTKMPLFFLTDAFPIPNLAKTQQKNIIHGDRISISIALASIIAKLERDTFMENISKEFPLYGFDKHKGYGTLYHRTRIQAFGPCAYHRTQFIHKYV